MEYGQEGGGVSRVNIGSLITASVTSRHTSVIFKMAGKFLVRYVAKRHEALTRCYVTSHCH